MTMPETSTAQDAPAEGHNRLFSLLRQRATGAPTPEERRARARRIDEQNARQFLTEALASIRPDPVRIPVGPQRLVYSYVQRGESWEV